MTGSQATPSASADPQVRLRGLSKRYGPRLALAGVDLTLDRREIVGVVGPDGAGKTTLLRSLAGLLEVEAEEASVLGFDLRDDPTVLKAAVGYVPQAFSLYRDLSVIENLRFTARLHRLPPEVFAERSGDLLRRTGLERFVDRAAGALSGGMKQKLAVANALLVEPRLLLLDEPTAGVDVLARAEIWTMLERERGRALVMISTSYLDEAAACDRLVYLDRGRVLATGTPAEIRAAVPLELYRAWGDDPRTIAREARALSYVEDARATGAFVRIDVRRDAAPPARELMRDLEARLAGAVRLVERAEVDMESTLLSLARSVAHHAPGNGAMRR